MVAGCCTNEVTLNVSVHRLWKAAACEDHIHMPKIIPEYFASAELAGDGEAGSTKIFHFTPAAAPMTYVKDHVEVLDHGSHTRKYRAVEGGHLGRTLKSHAFEVKFEAAGADSCVVKTKIEYDTIGDAPLPAEEVQKMTDLPVKMMKAVEASHPANTFIDAMVAGCCTEELTLNVSVHRVWKAAVCEDHILLPKIMPQYFSGAELIGDGEAGSTKIFHFAPELKPLVFVKNHVEVLDHASHTLKYKTVDGGHLGHTLKSHTIEYRYEALSADTCAMKVKVSYDTIADKELPEEDVKKIKEGTSSGSSDPSSSSSSSSDSQIKRCADCRTTTTPLWRAGPSGPKPFIRFSTTVDTTNLGFRNQSNADTNPKALILRVEPLRRFPSNPQSLRRRPRPLPESDRAAPSSASASSSVQGTMASKSSSDSREPGNEQIILNTYASMRSEINQIYSKITELEMEVSEHSLVIGAIQPLDPSRRCYRMTGGVLVERTIKEVLPAVQRNKEGLEEVIARLNEALENKKKEISEFELKYKIKTKKADSETKEDPNRKEGSAQGTQNLFLRTLILVEFDESECQMGSEGGGGRFFHLFDWNRKSRKKLFSSGNASSENTVQGIKIDYNVPASRFHLIDQDELEGVSSAKGSSHHSGASTTDEEGNAFKTPGVIARLMGLDYVPNSGVSEPYSTPLHGSRLLQDDNIHKRGTERFNNDNFYSVDKRSDGHSAKPESKSQKMPSSPIERFQTEMLPPRLAKTIAITHHKLLSPVKNPGFISSKNASYIIEAAAKILESELHGASTGRVQSFKSPSNHSKVCESNGIIAIPKKISMLSESLEGIAGTGAPASVGGQTLKRNSKGPKDSTVGRPSPSSAEVDPSGAKGKGKLVSLATQTKVNAQRRDGSSTKTGNTIMLKNKEECTLNKPLKSPLNDQKNNQHKRASTVNGSHVLRQNNRKQNCASGKSKLPLPSSISEQQGIKILPGGASSENNKIVSKLPGNAKVGHMKKDLGTADLDKDKLPSGHKNFTRKKRLVEQRSSIRCGPPDDIPLGSQGKRVQHNVVLDGHPGLHDDNTRSVTDVVSFTFTSPMKRPISGSQASNHEVKNQEKKNDYFSEPHEADSRMSSHLKLHVVDGDSLGILIERKLRELTSGAKSPYCKLARGGSGLAHASVLDDSTSSLNVPSVAAAEQNTESLNLSFSDELSGSFDSDSLASDQVDCISHELQNVDGMEHQGGMMDDKKSNHQGQSATSCYSIECRQSTHGFKMGTSSSSIQARDMVVDQNCMNRALLEPTELEEISDAASSSVHGELVSEINVCDHAIPCKQEFEYVKDILTNTGFTFENLIPRPFDHSFEILDPILFDKLEETKTFVAYEGEGEEENLKTRRRMLFDSVNECLDLRCSHYFRAGYRSWARGVAVAKELAEELYKEISGWKSGGDWMVDELVDKDMSTRLGSWTTFEIEAFEAGVEFETEVLSCLLDEVVADLS
ncbi:hypothetical protein MUK42_16448 [Musa troglodytarum]|uniref:GATA-type domain-containing protein n=1 Tax=Musa troglodytarum TaxID=320322 RepID=A0A9E7KUV6_9LILI|nr:hypothetical protein MUK42_16448 [Musa troglodytarum]